MPPLDLRLRRSSWLFLLFLGWCLALLPAQVPQWGLTETGGGGFFGGVLATDDGVYAIGHGYAQVTVDGLGGPSRTLVAPSQNSYVTFLVKYRVDGSVEWCARLGAAAYVGYVKLMKGGAGGCTLAIRYPTSGGVIESTNGAHLTYPGTSNEVAIVRFTGAGVPILSAIISPRLSSYESYYYAWNGSYYQSIPYQQSTSVHLLDATTQDDGAAVCIVESTGDLRVGGIPFGSSAGGFYRRWLLKIRADGHAEWAKPDQNHSRVAIQPDGSSILVGEGGYSASGQSSRSIGLVLSANGDAIGDLGLVASNTTNWWVGGVRAAAVPGGGWSISGYTYSPTAALWMTGAGSSSVQIAEGMPGSFGYVSFSTRWSDNRHVTDVRRFNALPLSGSSYADAVIQESSWDANGDMVFTVATYGGSLRILGQSGELLASLPTGSQGSLWTLGKVSASGSMSHYSMPSDRAYPSWLSTYGDRSYGAGYVYNNVSLPGFGPLGTANVTSALLLAFGPAAPTISADPDTDLPLPDLSTECDDPVAHTGTAAFVFQVRGSLPTGARVVVTELGSQTVLLDQPAAIGQFGVGARPYPEGATTVRVEIRDALGAVLASDEFAIAVADTTAPVLTGITAKVIEMAGVVTPLDATLLQVGATDACDAAPTVEFAPAMLGFGTTAVQVTGRDHAGNSTIATIDVTVRDTIKPEFITFPDDILRECTAACAHITFALAAEDADASTITFQCVAVDVLDANRTFAVDPSGTDFPIGTFRVVCTADDHRGNVSEPRAFLVSVVDTTAPVITVPDDRTVANDAGLATSAQVVQATAYDACSAASLELRIGGPQGPVVANGSSYPFPIGTTEVHASATDASSNSSHQVFRITVLDVEAPQIVPPATTSLVTTCGGAPLAVTAADLGLAASDNADASPALSFTPSVLAPGTTSVQVTARDVAGNVAQAAFAIEVKRGAFATQMLRPMEDGVDNRIRAGRVLPLKLRVACDGVVQADATAIVASIQCVNAAGTVVANEVPDDAGLSNDSGGLMRWSPEGFYMFNLSTSGWTATVGARHVITLRVQRAGHIDTLHTITTVNR